MDKKEIKKLLKEKLSDEDIEKLEKILLEENMQKKEKIEILKRLIKENKYNIDPEKVAEKILRFFETDQEN